MDFSESKRLQYFGPNYNLKKKKKKKKKEMGIK